MKHKKAILLFGPTASGKSRLALDILKKYNTEIVNADSMQVYKEIKILSARPDKNVPKHHLYGFVSVKENFSVGKWHKLAAKKIKEINKKGKVALVVGGTGLYFRALIEGLVDMPEVPKANFIPKESAEKWKMLNDYKKKYRKVFQGINLNDNQRINRAISVYETTGMTLNDWQKKENKKYFKKNDFIKICLIPSKFSVEENIKKRFESMIKKGAIDEVIKYKKLKLDFYSLQTSNKIIGIKEIESFLDKRISMKELKESVLIRTRQYAKRQFTWQRGQMENWKGFADTNYLDLRKKILSYLSKT